MATDPRVATLALLQSIDASLKAILLVLSNGRAATPDAPRVDIDGPHGDPIIKAKDPRDWTGESMTGRNFSQCPPDYLDLLADRFDYFAGKEDDPKKANYNRLDAKRARAWSARLRNGYQVPSGSKDTGGAASDEPGF